jgi:integrase
MRKTFADRVHEALDRDIFRTQKALGHRNINSTVQYLSFKEQDIEAAILGM